MKSRNIFLKKLIVLWILFPSFTFTQWQSIPRLQHVSIKCMLTAGDSTVFVGGDMATLLRSTDNGISWVNVWNGLGGDTILSLGQGGGYIFAGTLGLQGVYRSSNNGDAWSVANLGLPPNTRANAFTYSNNTLFVATGRGVYSSTNLGQQWKVDTAGLRLAPGAGAAGIASAGSRLCTIKFPGGGVYTSPVDTIAWTSIGLDTVWGYAIAAVDTNIFAGTPKGIFLYSGEGKIWLPRNNGLPTYLYQCILTSVNNLLIVFTGCVGNGIYVSSDLGLNWKPVDYSVFGTSALRAMVTTRSYLIAGTGNGGWRAAFKDFVASVGRETPGPSKFVLHQNYPNPFNPSTVISYQLEVSGLVTVKIFDVLGREVALFVSEEKSAGWHSVTWNAAALPSGVYICRLDVGGFFLSKKLMLLR